MDLICITRLKFCTKKKNLLIVDIYKCINLNVPYIELNRKHEKFVYCLFVPAFFDKISDNREKYNCRRPLHQHTIHTSTKKWGKKKEIYIYIIIYYSDLIIFIKHLVNYF